MKLVSLRVITHDVNRLVEFYERTTRLEAQWRTEEFAELVGPSCTLAIGSTRTTTAAVPESNRTAIIEFRVDDVDAEYERLTGVDVVQKPTTMPWGNRSLLFRDPDGNLINFFSPPA